MLLSVTFVAFLAFQVLSVHLVPYATDSGVSAEAAAVALGLIGGASVPGRFLSGVLSERLGWSKTLAGALLGAAATIVCLTFVSHDWALLCIVALFGVCHGTRAVAVLGFLGRVFGTASLGELIGITIALGQLLSAPAPYIVGYWFDLGHSYTSTFVVLSLVLALGALLVLRLESLGPPKGASDQVPSLAQEE